MRNILIDRFRYYNNQINSFIKGKLLACILPGGFYFYREGHCPCCENNTIFEGRDSWLRDHFRCLNCGSIPRERALMLIVDKYYPDWRDLKIHESSPSQRGASERLKMDCRNYIPTQFFPDETAGEITNGIRNEDLENQTFPDEYFDIVVTQDVMEHVYDPGKAFSEIARTLKPGGAHIFTVPLVNKHKKSEVWATKGNDGEPVFLYEPEWHGNPVNAKGSPVTMHWGYDIKDFIKNETGHETIIEYIDDLHYGVRAEYIEVLVTIKPLN
jgi:hypothetical protein